MSHYKKKPRPPPPPPGGQVANSVRPPIYSSSSTAYSDDVQMAQHPSNYAPLPPRPTNHAQYPTQSTTSYGVSYAPQPQHTPQYAQRPAPQQPQQTSQYSQPQHHYTQQTPHYPQQPPQYPQQPPQYPQQPHYPQHHPTSYASYRPSYEQNGYAKSQIVATSPPSQNPYPTTNTSPGKVYNAPSPASQHPYNTSTSYHNSSYAAPSSENEQQASPKYQNVPASGNGLYASSTANPAPVQSSSVYPTAVYPAAAATAETVASSVALDTPLGDTRTTEAFANQTNGLNFTPLQTQPRIPVQIIQSDSSLLLNTGIINKKKPKKERLVYSRVVFKKKPLPEETQTALAAKFLQYLANKKVTKVQRPVDSDED
eukprot:Awhi_evm2s10173